MAEAVTLLVGPCAVFIKPQTQRVNLVNAWSFFPLFFWSQLSVLKEIPFATREKVTLWSFQSSRAESKSFFVLIYDLILWYPEVNPLAGRALIRLNHSSLTTLNNCCCILPLIKIHLAFSLNVELLLQKYISNDKGIYCAGVLNIFGSDSCEMWDPPAVFSITTFANGCGWPQIKNSIFI